MRSTITATSLAHALGSTGSIPHSSAHAAAPAASARPPLRLGRRLLLDEVEPLLVDLLHDKRRRLALPVIALPLASEPLALAREVPFAGAADTVVL